MEKNQVLFAEAPISKAVLTMAIPTVISMLVNVVYNMADTFFIGQTGDPNQVAAVSIAMPVFLIMMALGNMFGVGGTSLISRLLGQNKGENAKQVSSLCFYASIAVGVAVSILCIVGIPLVLNLIGSSDNTRDFAGSYLLVIALGAPLIMMSNAFSHIVRSDGAAKVSMIGLMVGSVVNIILDPIFISVFGMGVTGAAVATVIGYAASAGYYLWYLLRKSEILSIRIGDFKLGNKNLSSILAIGAPASMNNILTSVSSVLMNNMLLTYGDNEVAAMGVAMKASLFLVLLQLGIGIGIQPLVGYNYGAKNMNRLKSIVKHAMLYTVILGSVLTVIYFLFSEPIIRAFIRNEDVVTSGAVMLRALIVTGPFVGVLFVFTSAIQGMGKAGHALLVGLSRYGFAFIPLVFLLNWIFGLQGLVYTQAAADIVSTLAAILIFMFIVKNAKFPQKSPPLLERDFLRK